MRDVALIGRARSGKDTIGTRLVDRFGYTRLAFADPLKEMALEIDPWISADAFPTGPALCRRLSELVDEWGWERAKDEYPEVRRFLQHLGQYMRKRDSNYWVRPLIDQAHEMTGPIVVTDVRYRNEAETLYELGFRLVRVVRPGVTKLDHDSETELEGFPTPLTILNSGTLDDLRAQADSIAL